MAGWGLAWQVWYGRVWSGGIGLVLVRSGMVGRGRYGKVDGVRRDEAR